MLKLNTYDTILVVAAVALSICVPLGLNHAAPLAVSATIIQDRTVVKTIGLARDGDYTIPLARGQMTLRVAQGKIRVVACTCPNQRCVRSGWISKAGESVVCLPNKVAVEIAGAPEGDYHAVTY